MHALIVFCHPEPASFNGALRDVAVATLEAAGHTAEVSDLYGEGFDPAEGPKHYAGRANPEAFAALNEQRHAWNSERLPADVKREVERLERADLVILQFPLWWHATPAMLKGWMDRVFVSGGLYKSKMRYDTGYFRGKRAICSVTTGAPAISMAHNGRGGDIELLLWPAQYSLYYMGFDVLPPFHTFGVQGHGFSYAGEDEAKAALEASKAAWAKRLQNLDGDTPIPFPGWDDWDDDGVLKPGVAGHDFFIRAEK